MTPTTARPASDAGFSLIELLTTVLITSLLLGLAALPLRNFWFAQSLDGGTDAIVTELRKLQEDAASESHPLVFGARFVVGANSWTVFRYDPTAAGVKCTSQQHALNSSPIFNAPVKVKTITLSTDNSGTGEFTQCATAGDKVIFLYARGTSTGGTIVVEQPNTGKTKTISISVLTGRVTRT
jgi:prepilin-type N-terminal cleavage/methylation domain-containing protein